MTGSTSVSVAEAQNFSTTTKTTAQMAEITPRLLLRMLPWVQVSGGVYRVNRRKMVSHDDYRIHSRQKDGTYYLDPDDLRSMYLFRDMPRADIERIAQSFTVVEMSLGEEIFAQGDPADRFYIVAEGSVEIAGRDQRGNDLQLAVLGAGDFFGEMALIDAEKGRKATARALTPATLFALDQSTFSEALETTPSLRAGLTKLANWRKQRNDQLNAYGEEAIKVQPPYEGETVIDGTFASFEENPREYHLNLSQAVVRLHTRVADLYNTPIDQLREQLRLTIETMKEQQEWEIVNNKEFGLLNNVDYSMRVRSRTGRPTPDAMDDLLARVWKEPSFFLAHPRAIAAFGRECTRRGVPPPTIQAFNMSLLTWRGIPLVPCDKLMVDGSVRPKTGVGRTDILLMRLGESRQGVVGLHKTGLAGEVAPSLSVRSMGIDHKSIAEYLVSLYYSAAVLTEDALGVLEDVEVGYFHDYG